MGDRQKERWNFAADFAINALLKKEFHFVPEGGLYDEKFENMTAEAIYNKLPDMPDSMVIVGGIFQNGDMKVEIDKDGNMTINGKEVKPLDTHLPAPASKSERDDIEKDMQINIAKAMQVAKQAGKMPGGMEVFLEELLQPKLDWRNMLRQFVITTAKSDFSWQRPNRRHIHDDLYMPSLTGESLGQIVFLIDVSGSTAGKDQLRFFSEANGFLQQYDV